MKNFFIHDFLKSAAVWFDSTILAGGARLLTSVMRHLACKRRQLRVDEIV